MTLVTVAPFALAFTWLGMVLAISFVETPLRFTSPGITVALGVGIGRRVFRALNIAEALLAALLVVVASSSWRRDETVAISVLVALCIVLLVQAGVLRPLMDRRVTGDTAVPTRPSTSLHPHYVALECVKIVLLLALAGAVLGAAGIVQ
jgi:hypothetical protein